MENNVNETKIDKVEDNQPKETKEVDLLDLLDQDEAIKGQFQAEVDRRITKAIQTREKRHQEELKKQEQRSKMTVEELQQEKLMELEDRENKIRQQELSLKKVEYFKDNNIPMELIDIVNVTTEEEIEEASTKVMTLINQLVDSKVQDKLRVNGYNPPKESSNNSPSFSPEIFEGKTPEEINKIWNTLV